MTRPSRIRLVVLIEDLDRSSIQHYAVQLLQQIDRTWFAPEIWVLHGAGDQLPAMRAAGIDIVFLSERRRAGPRALLHLALYLWRRRPDVLYTFPVLPNIWGRLIAGLMRVRVVSSYFGQMPRRHERLLHRFSQRIITDAAGFNELMTLSRGTDPKQVSVIADDAKNASSNREGRSFTPTASMVMQTEKVLREIAQLGANWTTTDNGELPLELPLGPAVRQSSQAEEIDERGRFRPDRTVKNVVAATLTVYLPPAEQATGAAAVVCPGGGYEWVTIDKEGHDVARWLTTQGVAGLVLKYRLPRPDLTGTDMPWPLQDITQAFQLARENADQWRINPRRLGVIGFSAGGHMAAAASQADPDLAFAVLIYPVISMDPELTHKGSRLRLLGARPAPGMTEYYSFERHVTAQACPTLVIHARDDDVVKVANSILYTDALRRTGVPHEFWLYDKGGHGFGLGVNGGEVAEWPNRFKVWLQAQGLPTISDRVRA